MGFFKRHTRRGSYDLFSGYNHFMPDFSDLIWILVLFLVGMFLGGIVAAALTFIISPSFATTYGMVIVYPLQFIPAMLYASAKSRRNEGFEKGYALDSQNFGGRNDVLFKI